MQRISDYDGILYNHMEVVHRPGDRPLAREFLEALSLTVRDFAFTTSNPNPLLMVHADGEDLDITNNIIFLHLMSPAQAELDTVMRGKMSSDPELASALAGYAETMATRPGGTPHFGIRYRSMEAVDRIIDQLTNGVSDELKARVTVNDVPPYPHKREGIPDIRQVFVHTDVITTSPGGFGQLIELQCERPS